MRSEKKTLNTLPKQPAKTDEAREKYLINLAINRAEQQLLDGTASSQVITHFLKLGSEKAKLEMEILEKEKELVDAKTEALKSSKRMESLYLEAMKAFGVYSGNSNQKDDEKLQ